MNGRTLGFVRLFETVQYLFQKIIAFGLKSLLQKGLGDSEPLNKGRPSQSGLQLVKPRPLRFLEDYSVVEDDASVQMMFERLKRHVFHEVTQPQIGARLLSNEEGRARARVRGKVLREQGVLPERRPFFFLQPLNENGWLFERTPTGWIVARAQKIVATDSFVRAQEPFDVVQLMAPKDGGGVARVSSKRMATALMSFAVYEQKLLDELNL